VRNADGTVDIPQKNLELKFARMFLARLQYECAGLPAEHLMHAPPEAHALLARGLAKDDAD
jgi:hypothetical protein